MATPAVRRLSAHGCLLACLLLAATTQVSVAQQRSPAEGPWSGQAQCVVVAKGADYQDEQTHTWSLTGAAPAPAPRGSAQVYYGWPATWTVQGGGRKVFPSRGAAREDQTERWTTASEMNATLRITEIAGTPLRLRIGADGQRGAPLGSIRVTDVSGRTRDGAVQPWPFPAIEDNAASMTISGSSTRTYPEGVGVGWAYPPKAVTTATCTWSFTRSGVAQSSANAPAGGRGRPDGARGTITTTTPAQSSPASTTILSTGPRATSVSPTDAADLETVVMRDPTAGAGTSWPRNGTARYLVAVTNRGPATASGAVLRVPPSSGLTKQVAICSSGALCPAGLTAGTLESGVSLPAIPMGGTVAVSFYAWVTGQVGGSVTVTASVGVAATPDLNAANNSSTHTHTIGVSSANDPSMALATYLVTDPQSITVWSANGTARYRATITLNGIPTGGLNPNTTTTTADGAVIAVPAVANLAKTSVTCTATNGAECPATVTVAALENGVIIPKLPDRGTVTFAFSANVTGPAGSSVTVRSIVAPPVGHVTPDASYLTKSLTQSILPSGGGTSSGSALGTSTTGTQQSGAGQQTGFAGGGATVDTLTKVCAMPGPNVRAVATPGGVHLRWNRLQDPAVAPAGPTYTVSRTDLGLLTPQPLGNPPFDVTGNGDPRFTDKVLLSYYAPVRYTYTVEAKYVQGCGSTSITVDTPRPWAPGLSIRECVPDPRSGQNRFTPTCDRHEFSPEPTQLITKTRATLTGSLNFVLEWFVPSQVLPYGGDNVGWIVHGPGLPANGVFLEHHCGRPSVVAIGGCNPVVNTNPGGGLELSALSPGLFPDNADYVWTVAAVWETPTGRFWDVPTAARVVLRIE